VRAELLFRNGHLFDGRRHHRHRAVAVSRGRVRAVVAESDAAELMGSATRVVDLAGGLLLPGFQDGHVHPVQAGMERMRCDLSELSTREEYLASIRQYAAKRPDVKWICGGGWSMPAFGPRGPTAADLDAAVSDRPVFLPNRDHHAAWVNTLALDLAGIDQGTSDPSDGRIERDAESRPTGTLQEGAMALVQRLIPTASIDERLEALLTAQEYLHGLGVTAWQDAIIGDYAGIDDPAPAYVRAADEGILSARVRGALWWDRGAGLEQIESLVERRRALTRGRFVANTVKVMQDGVVENYTAAMTLRYRDGKGAQTPNTGLSFVDPALLNEAVTMLDAEGFQVHVHAIGDRAVREALDAFEVARTANETVDRRHHIAHVQVVHPADRARFSALGVTANVQPLWAAYDDQMVDMTMQYLDPAQVAWQYPFGDLARAGASLAAGSDWPVSTPDPLQGIHVAVNRRLPGQQLGAGSEAFLPEQALSVEQAFAAYTSGSAFVNHLDETGRVAEGYLADLVILDRDPFEDAQDVIGDAAVVATYLDGHPVHQA
jgi:predicted amidohydrolase YtcJ